MGMLRKRVLSTPLDRPDGALGPKRLAILVALVLVVGTVGIFLVQNYIEGIDTWEATVTGVASGTVNFSFEEDSDDLDVATYPEGMVIKQGDRVLIRTDEDGNSVVKVLDD
jgi:hypothetical protein